ncbi:MAG: hypothetical protein [Circular genetic element sp.]|nr:MAG: hypothetical protein [Circular genetic element sp.]
MAYTINTYDIVEMRVIYVQNAQKLMNVFHFQALTGGNTDAGATDLLDLLTAFSTDPAQWVAQWSPSASNTCVLQQLQAQVIFGVRRPYIGLNLGIPGSVVGGQFPQNVQLGLTKVGTVADRHGVGQVQVPGIHGGLVADGQVSPAGQAWLNLLKNTLVKSFIPGGGNPLQLVPCILNRAAPLLSQIVAASRIQLTSRVARRRTVRVGE